jgi:hypothetical protein
MSSEAMHEFLQTIEAEVQSRPTPIEFEMAYQARVVIDRIRFAIKHTEQFGPRTVRCAKLACNCWMLFRGLRPLIAGSRNDHGFAQARAV